MMEQTLKIFCWMCCSSDVKPWPSPVFYLFIHVNDAVVSTTQICFPANLSPVWSLTTFSREWWNYSFLCPCQSQCSQHMELDMYGPDNSNGGTFGMNRNVWGSSLAWSRRFLYQKLLHFLKDIRSWVENECCCMCIFDISNIKYTKKTYIYTYMCAMMQWHDDVMTWKRCPHQWISLIDGPVTRILCFHCC